MKQYIVDLNSDLGEGFGAYAMPCDEEIIGLVSSANIACGWHAGDPLIMGKSIKLCQSCQTAEGAHPSYPDLMGFGRRAMKVSPAEAEAYIVYQVGALQGFCRQHGAKLQHVKPHGALYNAAAKDLQLARAIARGIRACGEELIFLGLSGSCMEQAASEAGLAFAGEVFADRAYSDDGSLVPRGQAGAVIDDEDEAVSRTIKMIQEGRVVSQSGKEISIVADSVCVHGDTPKAMAFLKALRSAFAREGIEIAPLGRVLEVRR